VKLDLPHPGQSSRSSCRTHIVKVLRMELQDYGRLKPCRVVARSDNAVSGGGDVVDCYEVTAKIFSRLRAPEAGGWLYMTTIHRVKSCPDGLSICPSPETSERH